MVALDDAGRVVRPALLWNDTRSAPAAADLTAELGGPEVWAREVGLVPVASFTITKLRWLADHEPDAAARTSAVCLPHDWLTWRLAGSPAEIVTDRSDASGTGYWSAATGSYLPDLLDRALGHPAATPRVAAPDEVVGTGADHDWVLGPGCGDNAGAALGLGAGPGDVVVSLGTSGVVTAVSLVPAADATGAVAGLRGRLRPLPAAGRDAERRPGARRHRAPAGRRPCRPQRPRALRAPGRGRSRAGPLPPGRAHSRPPRRDRFLPRPHPRRHHARAPRPSRRRGAVVRPGRRARRAARAGRDRRAGPARRGRRGLTRRPADRGRGARRADRRTAGRGVRRPRRGPSGRVGARPGLRAARRGRPRVRRGTCRRPTPGRRCGHGTPRLATSRWRDCPRPDHRPQHRRAAGPALLGKEVPADAG